MAYKTAEERHEKQNLHEGSFSTENKLRKYLRENYDKRSLENEHAAASAEKPLAKIAMDYDAEVGKVQDEAYYIQMARGAIADFLNSNAANEPGEDDRGKRLGETWKNVTDTLSDLRY